MCLVTLLILIFVGDATASEESITLPRFSEPIPNVRVPVGGNVSLPCVIDNLGTFRVAWIHTDRFTLLTLQSRVIVRSSRYKSTHDNYRTWWLHISEVQEIDEGEYMCQINTTPMMEQTGYIEVVVPPRIEEKETSSDTVVQEGSDVSLRCVAKGTPEPEITWRREDNQEITIDGKKVTTVNGPYLNVRNVTRLQMGAYLCTASNGIQPSQSKRIVLNVTFAPVIRIPNQLVRARVNRGVSLDCNVESFPASVTYWNRDGKIIVLTKDKYDSVVLTNGLYKVNLRLTIRNLMPEDFGTYTCVAKNSMGETEGTIRLYGAETSSSATANMEFDYSYSVIYFILWQRFIFSVL